MGSDRPRELVAILGTTASGKTRLGARLARRIGGEIISADSRQVFRGMDVGTGKDLDEYVVEGERVPVHLVNVADPNDDFNLYRFVTLFRRAYAEIRKRRRLPFLVGGSGMYLSAVLQGYRLPPKKDDKKFDAELRSLDHERLKRTLVEMKPDRHNKTDLVDKERTIQAIKVAAGEFESAAEYDEPPNALVLGVRFDPEETRRRIETRLRERIDGGMIEEVRRLMDEGVSRERMRYFGLEYRYVSDYLAGESTFDEMFAELNRRIAKFAKRQRTWFRKMEREGAAIRWIDGPDYEAAARLLDEKEFDHA
jgi:tRNA dimethylallyltransferase